jgi:hypothetical protein
VVYDIDPLNGCMCCCSQHPFLPGSKFEEGKETPEVPIPIDQHYRTRILRIETVQHAQKISVDSDRFEGNGKIKESGNQKTDK